MNFLLQCSSGGNRDNFLCKESYVGVCQKFGPFFQLRNIEKKIFLCRHMKMHKLFEHETI